MSEFFQGKEKKQRKSDLSSIWFIVERSFIPPPLISSPYPSSLSLNVTSLGKESLYCPPISNHKTRVIAFVLILHSLGQNFIFNYVHIYVFNVSLSHYIKSFLSEVLSVFTTVSLIHHTSIAPQQALSKHVLTMRINK